MSCTVKYNKEGGVKNVLTPSGVESKLFKSIARLPHVNSLEDAVDMYKNIYASKLEAQGLEVEPKLAFMSDKGASFPTFAEALKDSNGGDIKVAMDIKGELHTIQKVSSNTNPATFEGFVNNYIKEGILSDSKILEDGKSYFKAAGNDQRLQMVNEVILKDGAITDLGAKNFKIHIDGRIELRPDGNSIELDGKNIDIAEIRKMPSQKLIEKFGKDIGLELAINNAVADMAPSGARAAEATTNEKDLKLKLLDLLNNMGVKVMTLDNYISKYESRNGVEPSAKALADIANQVVAFKDGVIGIEELSEETAHFIVETWDQTEIEPLLRNAHKTDTYQEFANIYREVYSRENPNMSAEEVEDLVRREVLGKELANAMRNGFNTENKTDIQKSILQRILDFFNNFFSKLTTNESFYDNLQNLTIKVEDLLLTQDINKYLNLGQTATKKFRLYQVQSTSGNTILDAKSSVNKLLVKALIEQEKSLIKTGRGSSAEVQRLMDVIEKEATKSSILELAKLAKRQARYVGEAINRASKNNETLTNEEGIVLHNLKNVIQPLLTRLQVITEKEPELAGVAKEIEAVTGEILRVEGTVENTQSMILDNIIDRIMVRHSISDEHRDKLKQAVDVATRDTQTLYTYFGQITHAHDPLLNLLGSVVSDMSIQAEQRYMKKTKTFLQEITKLGFQAKDVSKFYDKDGYILSLYDWSKFDEDILTKRAELYKQYNPSTPDSIEVIKQKISDRTIEKISDKQADTEYKNAVTSFINSRVERAFTDEFYKKREERYDKLNISSETRGFLRLMSTDLGQLLARVKTEGGLPRYRAENRHEIIALNLRRKQAKSFYNEEGVLKNGVRVVDYPVANSVQINGDYFVLDTTLPVEARLEATIAFDINKLDKAMMEEKNEEAKKNGQPLFDAERLAPKFLDELKRIESEDGREAAVEFFTLNTTIGFPGSFWDSYDRGESLMTILDSYHQRSDAEPETVERIEIYKEKLAERKAILKQFQDSNNYTNTLAEEMTAFQKERIIELSESIDHYYSLLSSKFSGEVTASQLEDVESTPNQAYYEALQDSRIDTDKGKIEFALKHMTSENKRRSMQFMDILDKAVAGLTLSDRDTQRINRAFPDNSINEIDKNNVESFKLKYVESKLAPYYRAFSPEGLADFYTELNEGQKPVTALVEEFNKNPNVKLSNNFSYYEVGAIKDKNENYREGFEGGHRQPKLFVKDSQGNTVGGYLNQRFVDMFAPKLDAKGAPVVDANGKMVVSKNEKLYDLYHTYMEFQKDNLRSYGELGTHNIYLAPQVSKSFLEKSESLIKNKKGTLKDWWQDITRYRVDELAFGEEIDGDSLIKTADLRIIPKTFLRRLESSTDVSTDLFSSSALFAQQAELYKARREKFSEFTALKDKLMNRAYPGGKAAQATNTYKMFMSYMDYNLFGVKESKQWRVTLPFLGQVDMTKIITRLHNWLKDNSLALNVIVPLTSWFTAESSIFIERLVGQYVDKSSLSLASREFRRLATDGMKEGLSINSTSRISVLGEYFGVFDLSGRVKDSKYSATVRGITGLKYAGHTAANFMPLSKVLLSQLYGHRIYGDTIVDYKKFKELAKAENKDIKPEEISAKWSSLKDKSLYNYIITENGVVSYSYDKLAADLNKTNDEAFRKDFENIELGVTSKVKKLIERVDGQIKNEERTMLQRDVFGRFTMTHKGWLSIAASNRFKRRHLNLQTGEFEEGTYLSFFRTFTEGFNKGFTSGGLKAGFKGLKDAYKNGDDVQREAIRRTLIELSVLSLLYALSVGIGAWADDDEDNWTAQFTSYMFDRVTNETASSQFGVMGEFYKSFKEPIVGLNKIEDLASLRDLVDGSKVARGRYKGYSKSQVYLLKNITGAKGFFDLSTAKNLKSQRDAYDFFNDEETWVPLAYIIDEDFGILRDE